MYCQCGAHFTAPGIVLWNCHVIYEWVPHCNVAFSSPPPPPPPPPPHTHTHTIQTNGAFTFRLRGDAYRHQVRFRYDPFCVKSSILIVAEVEESGRGTNQSATLTIPLVANPVSVKFTDENPKLFKPGLNHTMKVRWCESKLSCKQSMKSMGAEYYCGHIS